MQRRSGLALAILSIAFAAILAVHPVAAFDFTVANPVVHGNLAVYPVHGPGSGGGNLLTLDEAAQQGTVKIHESDNGPLQIANASDRGLFVQAGTLLVGGLQDQVVSADTIVGPHSTRSLYTFCVDPFRSTARSDVDANAFTGAGALFPWSAAKLSLMTGLMRSDAARSLRQTGVWWSIDTLRSRLSERIGEAVEPAQVPVWSRDEIRESRARLQLAARTSPWTTSLPLALQNQRLAQTVGPYVGALQRVVAGHNVIGAVIAIDGKFTSADVYGSSDLMRRMWPALARAAATEAIAAGTATAPPVPPVASAKAFLEAALAAPAQVPPAMLVGLSSTARFALTGLRETQSTIAADTITSDGTIHRSVVAKLDPAAATRTPEALIVQMLAADSVKLNDGEVVVLQRSTTQDGWVSDVRSVPRPADMRSAASIEPGQVRTDRIVTALAASESAHSPWRVPPEILPLTIAVAILLAWLGTMLVLGRRRRRLASRAAPVAASTSATAKPVQADAAQQPPAAPRLRIAASTPHPESAGAARRHVVAPPSLQAA
jgi:hypothetical protein